MLENSQAETIDDIDAPSNGQRKIIHVDMDAFFASVEQRDNPEYRGQPLIVGGDPDRRGVVAACSYEARVFGIHSAMSSSRAKQLCPAAIFVKPRFDAYKEASLAIHEVFHRYTDLVEPLSLDEAYLDVSQSPLFSGSATLIAKDIKQKIYLSTGLTASAGISYNKFLAKIASDMDKPNGLFLILPQAANDLLESLAIRKFHGIGKATETKMKALGIHNGYDLKQWGRAKLQRHFGRTGVYYFDIVRGIDHRRVENNRVRKSMGAETTFSTDLIDRKEMLRCLEPLAAKVVAALTSKKFAAQTITLKVKFDNFQQITRSHTEAQAFTELDVVLKRLTELMQRTEAGQRKVRLLGLSLSNLTLLDGDTAAIEQISLL